MTDVNDKLARHTESMRLAKKGGQNTPVANVDSDDALGGVTVGWLASVFRMDPKDVKRRLADCHPIVAGKMTGRGVQGRKYELKDAAAYLIPPKISHGDFMRSIKKGDLPPSMQQTFWSAKLAEQKWLENADQLWRTEKVREVLGDTFQALKFAIQLWPDMVRGEVGLSDQQQDVLMRMGDKLQGELYEALVNQMKTQASGPQSSEYDSTVKEADRGAGFRVNNGEVEETDEYDDPEADALV
jgi:hypothetical protein